MDPIEIAVSDLERWDQQLVELVKNEKIDPWQIDLEVLIVKYLEKIEGCLDFRVPARAVATVAVLLKMKAETLRYEEDLFWGDDRLEMPVIESPPVRMTSRRITIFDLVNALKETINATHRRRLPEVEYEEKFWEVNPFDMNKYLEGVEAELKEVLEKGNVTFEQFRSKLPLIFLALLYLAHKGKINLVQKGWNQDIQIQAA